MVDLEFALSFDTDSLAMTIELSPINELTVFNRLSPKSPGLGDTGSATSNICWIFLIPLSACDRR